MHVARTLLFATLLPLFAGCQLFAAKPDSSVAGQVRMQGNLTASGGHLIFQPCNEQRRYDVNDLGNTGILQEASSLAAKPGTIFADVRGRFAGSKLGGVEGQLDLYRMYRVQRAGSGCEDLNFKRLTLHADGNGDTQTPGWSMNISDQGMVLQRKGEEPLALPYVEEQLPDGRFNLNSEANGKTVELWVAPQRCVNLATGAVQHLSAELRINGVVQLGCGYYGGMRND